MARQPRRRPAQPSKAAQSNTELLIGVLVVAIGIGYYGYKQWNTPLLPAIVGKAWVIDGDTIAIAGTHIRLEGIDAPESDQPCTDPDGKSWACGRTAASELKAHIRGEELTCRRRTLDKYHRVLAVCTLPDGSDVNAWMVRQGWAVSYGFAGAYGSEEAQARADKRGIWAGSFMMPSRWRQTEQD